MSDAARMKGMIVIHQGRELSRYVYFGANAAFVHISKRGYEVCNVAPGKWETVRALPDIEYFILVEQAEADKWTEYQREQCFVKR